MRAVAKRLEDVNNRLTSGKLSVDEWATEFDAELLEGHLTALRLGFERAGSFDYDESRLAGVARGIKDTESEFLTGYTGSEGEWHPGWIANLKDPADLRYHDQDGNLRPGSLDSRADLYVGKMRGSANQAFVEASPEDTEYDWDLSGGESCGDCIELSEGGPYTADTLYTYPGWGDTECLGRCACVVIRSDGQRGFGNHNEDAADLVGDSSDEEDDSAAA